MSNRQQPPGLVGQTLNRLQIGCMALVFNLLLGGFCLWGGYAAYNGWRLETQGETTTGRVVRLEESSNGDGGCCVYSPVVEFQAAGKSYSFEGGTASDPPQYKVNQQVKVRYDPANPANAQIDSFVERWLFPILIIPIMSLTALILNFFMIRAWWRGTSIDN